MRLFWILFLCAVPATAESFGKKVTWTTGDGVTLVGWYQPASRAGAWTWIFLHGLGSNAAEWRQFARQVARQGNGVLIYDARGHGESTRTKSGETLDYRAWQNGGAGSPWSAMPADLGAAVTMLRQRKGVPEKRIAVGGASLGANVALSYAGSHPAVPAVLLLSPGIDYAGIQTLEAWKQYGARRALLAASPGDVYAYSTVRQLCVAGHYSVCPAYDGPGSAHGVAMLDDAMTKRILAWMKDAPWK